MYVHLATFHIRQNASFSRSQPDFEGFLRALRFSPSTKLTPSLFQFDRMQDLPENHFRVSGASWVNIINFFFLIRNRASHFVVACDRSALC